MNINNLEFKSIFLKANYLTTELEFAEDSCSKYKDLFFKKVLAKDPNFFSDKTNKQKNLKKDIEDILIEEESPEKVITPKDFDVLYKKIMIIVHPDKLMGLSEKDRARYDGVSAKANLAKSNGDWFSLLLIADKLNISDIEISDDNIDWLKSYCSDKELEIKKIKESIFWIWFNSDENIKQILISNFFKKNKK